MKNKKRTLKSQLISFMKRTVKRRKNNNFTGAEINSVNTGFKSALRTMRHLKEASVIDYEVVNHRKSLYRLTELNS
jgi:hypothetical protein